jgi:hypothetical protein
MSFTIDYAKVRNKQKLYWSSVIGSLFGREAKGNVVNQKLVKGVYDVALQGGTIGAKELGAVLPAGAILTRAYYEVITPFTTAGANAGTIALKVGATNLKAAAAATDTASWGAGRKDGIQTGAASVMSKITADSNLIIEFAGQVATAGKLQVFVEYVI